MSKKTKFSRKNDCRVSAYLMGLAGADSDMHFRYCPWTGSTKRAVNIMIICDVRRLSKFLIHIFTDTSWRWLILFHWHQPIYYPMISSELKNFLEEIKMIFHCLETVCYNFYFHCFHLYLCVHMRTYLGKFEKKVECAYQVLPHKMTISKQTPQTINKNEVGTP
jgi:hypothetical protein